MREFKHTTGGRYDYSEDIHGLQEFVKALTSLFMHCGKNFVLNGCKVSDGTYSEGCVWLNGKIRYVPEASFTIESGENVYIEADDVNGNVIDYGDASQGVMNISYGAKYSHSTDIEDDSLVIVLSDGSFPSLNDTFFRYYTLVRKGKKQVFNDYLTINDAQFDHQTGKFAIYNGSYELRVLSEGYVEFYRNGSRQYGFKGLSFYNASGQKVFTIGREASGAITLPSMTDLDEMEVRGNVDAETAIKINNTNILSIFAYTNYPVDTGWVHLINSKTNAEMPSLYVRQIRERVIIKGTIPKEYVTSFNDSYVSIISKSANTIDDSSWVLYKLNIKLPSSISAPNANRLPGCVLSSNYQATENLACNNVELHVGADNFLYISGKPINMNWYSHTVDGVTCTGPTINFNYLID